MNSYSWLLFVVIVSLVVAAVGGYFGFTVNGVAHAQTVTGQPGWWSIVTWAWNSVSFIFYLITFQVDGVPIWISSIFLVCSLMTVFVLVRLVRGTD